MSDIDKKLEKLHIQKALIRQELARSYQSLKEQVNPYYWAGGAGLAVLNHVLQSDSGVPSDQDQASDLSSPPPRETSTEDTSGHLGSAILKEILEYVQYRMEKEAS
jgi:hypothetical protein